MVINKQTKGNNMDNLSKLYRVVNIQFSSLRNGFGDNYGVVLDIDTIVKRKARRVLCDEGWRWQIKDITKIAGWDYFVILDQEVLDNIGMDEAEVEVING